MHGAIAARLPLEPELLNAARERVQRWLLDGSVHLSYAEAWRDILTRSPAEVAAFLIDPDEKARALRQSSPFAFAIDPRTRWRIHRDVARADR